MSRTEQQKIKVAFAALAYHQQVAIITRLLPLAPVLSGDPVRDGMRMAQALTNGNLWQEAEPLIRRARSWTPV